MNTQRHTPPPVDQLPPEARAALLRLNALAERLIAAHPEIYGPRARQQEDRRDD